MPVPQPKTAPSTRPLNVVLISQTSAQLQHKICKDPLLATHLQVNAHQSLPPLHVLPTVDILLLEMGRMSELELGYLQHLHQKWSDLSIILYTLDSSFDMGAVQNKLPFVGWVPKPNMHNLHLALEHEIRQKLQPPEPVQLRIVQPTQPHPSQHGEPENMFFRRPKIQSPGALVPQDPSSLTPASEEPPVTNQPSFPPVKEYNMANISQTLETALSTIDGATAAVLVEYNSGMMLGSAGGGVNLELAAAGNTDVVKAKMRTMQSLGISGNIDDILITLDNQYHIIYLVPGQTLFLYLVLQKDRANLALARYKLKALGAELKV